MVVSMTANRPNITMLTPIKTFLCPCAPSDFPVDVGETVWMDTEGVSVTVDVVTNVAVAGAGGIAEQVVCDGS